MKEEEMEIYDGEKWVELNVQNLTKICDVHGLIELIKQTTKKEHQMKDKDNTRDYVLWTLTAFMICFYDLLFCLYFFVEYKN